MTLVNTPSEQKVILNGVSWETYARLLREHQRSPGTRFNYDRGALEIMVLSFEHESINRLLASFVELLATELEMDFECAGSTTFRREDLSQGFEPDTCLLSTNSEAVCLTRVRPIWSRVLISQPDGSLPPHTLGTGRYRLRVMSLPAGSYIERIEGGNADQFTVEPGKDTKFTVILAEHAGVVQGTVADAKDMPIRFGFVALVPDDRGQPHRLVTTSTEVNGTFVLHAGPGTYRLFAWRKIRGAPYFDSEFLQESEQSGVPLRVESDSHQTLRLTVPEK